MQGFRELRVWQTSMDLAEGVHHLTLTRLVEKAGAYFFASL